MLLYDRLITEWLVNDNKDVVCFDLKINTGERLSINVYSQRGYCAQIARFIKREFVKGMTFPEEIKAGDDWYFAEELVARNPDIVFTGVTAYRYNFPRDGSLSDLQRRGLI